MPENTYRLLALKAEPVSFNIEYAINALYAVHTAMDADPFTASSFTGALYCIWDYLSNQQKELNQIIDKMIKEDTE